jgi:hypothetical protein
VMQWRVSSDADVGFDVLGMTLCMMMCHYV